MPSGWRLDPAAVARFVRQNTKKCEARGKPGRPAKSDYVTESEFERIVQRLRASVADFAAEVAQTRPPLNYKQRLRWAMEPLTNIIR